MSISDIVAIRSITQILHFTTDKGLVGTFAKRILLSRQRLPQEQLLSAIATMNCDTRKDAAWVDYVSMSITRVNPRFFDYSINKHRGERHWWCVLSFDPQILSHEGVYFATTNNIYTSVRQGTGAAGLEALFASEILQYVRWPNQRSVVRRPVDYPANLTTDAQAEVLYPGGIPIEYLRAVFVPNDDLRARAVATAKVLGCDVSVVVRPDIFTNRAASGV